MWLTSIAMVTSLVSLIILTNGVGAFGSVDNIVNSLCLILLNQIHAKLYTIVCRPCDKCMDICSTRLKENKLKNERNLKNVVNAKTANIESTHTPDKETEIQNEMSANDTSPPPMLTNPQSIEISGPQGIEMEISAPPISRPKSFRSIAGVRIDSDNDDGITIVTTEMTGHDFDDDCDEEVP